MAGKPDDRSSKTRATSPSVPGTPPVMRRRSLLIGSLAVAGGVVFGTRSLLAPHDNPLRADLPADGAALTPYVLITPDEITLIAPHADVGQGVFSTQALLLAEELDVEPDQVTLSFGEPAPAYYNTAITDDLLPFGPGDQRVRARLARAGLGTAAKVMGLMITGGSSSMPDSYDKLRQAGASARETLKSAAALQTGLPMQQLRTARGAVLLPDGSALPYGALARQAATLPPVQDVPLRAATDWRLLGKARARLDIPAKSTGRQRYSIDIDLPDMLHAAIRLNPARGGLLLGHDAGRAQTMRGVFAILALRGGVAVLADNSWRAFRALDEIDCDWGPAAYPDRMEDHWQALSDSIDDDHLDREWRHDGSIPDPADFDLPRQDGSAENSATGARLLELEYRAPYVGHQPLEPLCATVRIAATDTEPVRAEIWTAHQVPRVLQDKVAEIVGCRADQVRFHQQFAGGSFGHRLEFDFVLHCAQIATHVPGRPVKLTYSREEDFAQDYPRQIAMARARATLQGGQLQSLDLDLVAPSVTASQTRRLGQPVLPIADPQLAAGAWNQPVALANLRIRAYRCRELAPISSWRSVGASTQAFFFNAALDEAIHAAGGDPMEQRLHMMQGKGGSSAARAVLERVAQMCDWGRALPSGHGRGVAFAESFGVPVAEVVEVAQTEAGLVITDVWACADVGRVLDPDNLENQMGGAILWGLGHAMNCEITYAEGAAEQSNFFDHPGMRLYQCPRLHLEAREGGGPLRGIGEPPVPPAAPALAGAIFAATGQRLRAMPFANSVDFA